MIAEEIKSNILELVQDQNGNHVIQKIIEYLGKEDNIIDYYIDIFKGQVYNLSVHA